MIKLTQDFDSDFEVLVKRIFVDKLPTYFSRYADGELALMMGKEVPSYSQASLEDKWTAKSGKSLLGKDLVNSLKNNDRNKIYAISCGCCDSTAKKILLDNLKIADVCMSNITFSNLWINGNYKKFKNTIETQIDEKVVLFANKEGVNKKYPFELHEFFAVPDDCVNFWETERDQFISAIQNKFSSYNDTLFLISAGPMSEVIIEILFEMNKSNRYIDVGSSMDEFTKNRKTRPFMNSGQPFYNKNCEF
jgi:hypothetical protein